MKIEKINGKGEIGDLINLGTKMADFCIQGLISIRIIVHGIKWLKIQRNIYIYI